MVRSLLLIFSTIVLLIGGCDKGASGYVQIRLVPANVVEPISLYLDGTKLDFSHEPTVTLRLSTGRLALKAADSVWAPAICHLLVRKDRITALTVLDRSEPPRCVCEIPAADSTADAVVCS